MVDVVSAVTCTLFAIAYALTAAANITSGTWTSPITFAIGAVVYSVFAAESYFVSAAVISKYCFIPALIIVPKQVSELVSDRYNGWKQQVIAIALYLAIGLAQLALVELRLRQACQAISICLLVCVAASSIRTAAYRYVLAVLAAFSITIALAFMSPAVLACIPVITCITGLPNVFGRKKQNEQEQVAIQYCAKKRVSFSGDLPADSNPKPIARVHGAVATFVEKRPLTIQNSSTDLNSDLGGDGTEELQARASYARRMTLTAIDVRCKTETDSIENDDRPKTNVSQNVPGNNHCGALSAELCKPSMAIVQEGNVAAKTDCTVNNATVPYLQSKPNAKFVSAARTSHRPIALSVNFDIKH